MGPYRRLLFLYYRFPPTIFSGHILYRIWKRLKVFLGVHKGSLISKNVFQSSKAYLTTYVRKISLENIIRQYDFQILSKSCSTPMLHNWFDHLRFWSLFPGYRWLKSRLSHHYSKITVGTNLDKPVREKPVQ